jgi:hypothetical protein
LTFLSSTSCRYLLSFRPLPSFNFLP